MRTLVTCDFFLSFIFLLRILALTIAIFIFFAQPIFSKLNRFFIDFIVAFSLMSLLFLDVNKGMIYKCYFAWNVP